jgi:hypothetical protein
MIMAQDMGMGKLGSNICMMRKFRWLFDIKGVSGGGSNALPPDKGARPSLSFKEIEVQHVNETVYFPGKPDWKPITLTLFDLKQNNNPIFSWIKEVYDVCANNISDDKAVWATWAKKPAPGAPAPRAFKRDGTLKMFDGCGNVMEEWFFKNMWPNNVEWGDLSMDNSEYVTVELTLRYDRAWVKGC